MVTPPGMGSVKLTPLTAEELTLPIVMDKVEVPPPLIEVGENDLVNVRGDEI